MPYSKVQFNCYIRRKDKQYLEEITDSEGSAVDSLSDAMIILIAYAEKFWTQEDWNSQANRMRVLGEEGLVKI